MNMSGKLEPNWPYWHTLNRDGAGRISQPVFAGIAYLSNDRGGHYSVCIGGVGDGRPYTQFRSVHFWLGDA